ncbi:interferon-related developmental regulator 2 [Neodiprion virginianus]|uniref:interferon-related developmental regulator 2 n=1 Tax=Neodiprion virginianus TaxID=2961670 RepID=UPI001EE6B71A|nr:interferon-related developmental regulator 2 [Neodiprion virginianus]
MPGKGSKKRSSAHGGKRAELMSDDDSINNDACSVASGQSDSRSVMDDGNFNDNEVDEIAQQEALEEKLKEAIDGLTQKCAKSRTTCFNGIEKAFTMKYIPDFVEDRKMTITDSIERALKKGRGDEQSAAARLASLLCVQLGAFDSAEIIVKDLKTVLISTANNKSISPTARAECYWTLSMMQFLSGNDAADTIEIMQLLLTAFYDSASADLTALQATILSAWTLLLTLMASSDVHNLISSSNTTDSYMLSLNQIRELLESSHLELRLAAGDALAVIFELGRDYSEENEIFWAIDLIAILKDLATDSNRHRAKKDRKQQKASFRDILRYIVEDEFPELQIKFGHETLYLEDWCTRVQYTACCRLLGPGLNIHLGENKLLREIFNLGDRVMAPQSSQRRATKQQRNLLNAAAFKARTRQRNKNRDKRSATLAS